jgi:hypothetical protein
MMDLQELGCKGMKSIDVAQNWGSWLARVDAAMNLFPIKRREFLY